MTTTTYNESLAWQARPFEPDHLAQDTSVWQEAFAWLALLPMLFITVSGAIQSDNTPIAFRFTAMEEDSLERRIVRFGCSLLIVCLISSKFRPIWSVCLKSKILFVLPALAFVSAIWSQNPMHTLVEASSLLLTTLFAIYLYLRYPSDRIVSFLNFAAFISLILCLIAVVAFPSIGMDSYQQDAWRGIFYQKNTCATTCTLFLTVGLHTRTRGIVEKLIRFAVISLSILFIIMSASRTGWIVAVLAIILTYGLRFVICLRSLDRLLFLVLLFVPTLFVGAFIATNFNEILSVLDKDPTMTQRTIIWAEVVPSIAKHPIIGYGYSAFWAGLHGESEHTVLVTRWMEGQAQEGYLDIMLQLGLAGLIPLLAIIVRAFGQAIKTIENRKLDVSVLLAITLLPLVLVENIGETLFLLPLSIPWFYTLIALFTLSMRSQRTEDI